MSKDDLEPRILVKQAAAHQAKCVNRSFDRESPGRAGEPCVSFVGLLARFERQAGMKIERHVEVLNRGPERTVLRKVVEHCGIGDTNLRESIYERAAEAQLLDTTRQFLGCGLWVLHRQGGKSFEALGVFGDVF